MKKYKITINGKTYEVEVEQVGSEPAVFEQTAKDVTDAGAAEAVKEKPEQKSKPQGKAGKNKVTSPMPGTILSIKSKPGDKVKKGDVILILEAMKMENEISAPEDGVITSINVNEGASVNTGDLLFTYE